MTVELIQLCRRSGRNCKRGGFYGRHSLFPPVHFGPFSPPFLHPDFLPPSPVYAPATQARFHMVKTLVIKLRSLYSIHPLWKIANNAKMESGANYITAAHAFVIATLRLGLRAPLVACKNIRVPWHRQVTTRIQKPLNYLRCYRRTIIDVIDEYTYKFTELDRELSQ